ncbi:MAG: GWxTD domain-containing protein [Ignavibacteriales bacterium]|nr:GWxTD domain-containing protein [Ignavibacteriales bacterium]
MRVVWHDKPSTLMNPELAIGLLEYITDKAKVKSLLKGSSDKYYGNLVKFWTETFPGKKFAYNKLMAEFYERADYAQKNFSSINIPNGAKSDRGRIYIMYGQPDDVRRDYSMDKKVLEIWNYSDLKKEFVFADDTGLGNYKLSTE